MAILIEMERMNCARNKTGVAEMKRELTDYIKTEEALRDIIGNPTDMNVKKVISILDEHCRMFIAESPYLLLASADAAGNIDISPKGDPPGFVQVLDDHTLVIPDRIGNRRIDTLTNIVQNDQVGMLFMIPGFRESLRVSGRAMIARDQWLRDQMTVKGKVPQLAIVVKVEKAYIHCAKSIIRSKLWEPEQWQDVSELSPMSRVLIDHANLSCSVEELQEAIDDSLSNHLY